MATDNNILELTGKNVKYIVTKSKATLDLLQKSEGGPLIIYEPFNDSDYRELYAKNYFVAAGYGASSTGVQTKLENIAENYDANIEELHSGISGVEQSIQSVQENKLDKNANLSQNEITIPANNGNETRTFALGNLIENINGIKYNKLLEIVSINYEIEYMYTIDDISYTQKCTNKDKLPIDSKIKKISFNILINNNDSGIKDINISLYDQYKQNDGTYIHKTIFDVSGKNINKTTRSNISTINEPETSLTTISFTQNYKLNPETSQNLPYYQVGPNENKFFDNISITTLDTTDVKASLPLFISTADNIEITNNDDLILYGQEFINYKINNNPYKLSIIDNYDINGYYKSEFELTEDNITILEIKIPGTIISLTLFDNERNNKFELKDYLSLTQQQINNNNNINVYKFDLRDGDNSGNLCFLTYSNNATYLHKGTIQIIFSNNITSSIYYSGNNMNWISFEGGTNIEVLESFLNNGYK